MNEIAGQRFFPKELSWLSFNERVLQEAADKNNPIIERFRFLGIYSSNMDEFYRVTVADVRRKIIIQMNNDEQEEAEKNQLLMAQIQEKIIELTDEFNVIYKNLVNELAQHNIQLIDHHQVNDDQFNWLKDFFQNKVLRHISPILIEKKVNLVARLIDSATYYYLAIHRDDKQTKYATVEIPTDKMSRFIILPSLSKGKKYKTIILLEDVIQLFLEDIFLGFVKFDSIEAYSFKMTRDSEYSINDDIAESYVEKMSDSMK
jgi:polyphosphate kinase